MFKQRKHYNKSPMRRKVPGVGAETYRGRRTPIEIVGNLATTTHVTLTFDQPVIVKGVPQYSDATPNLPESVEVLSPTSIRLTYPATATLPLSVPFEDPGVRNNVGGFVNPGTVASIG